MDFELQPTLQNDFVKIRPLIEDDFEALYKVASDPLIWEQHPEPNRYKKEVFEKFFKGAIESRGAFLMLNSETNETIGSSRFYELDTDKKSVAIGYTFLARSHWGTSYNKALKSLMLNHAFKFVKNVIFHIGANNIRSQKAIEKLGAKKTGETNKVNAEGKKELNFVYQLEKNG